MSVIVLFCRSLAAHELLRDAGMDVSSFGVASRVKIPGLTQDAPNTYDFGVPYATICEDLRRKDEAFYVSALQSSCLLLIFIWRTSCPIQIASHFSYPVRS